MSLPLRVLVTGANGFVGRALCRKLSKQNYEVLAYTRTPRTFDDGIINLVIPALDATTDWCPALNQIDVVFHLAARVHVMHEVVSDPLAIFKEVNLYGTKNLAQQAAKFGVKRFVYVSSIKVNGEFTEGKPFVESDNPNPQDSYGVSKWEAERVLHEICRETGMELVIVRPPLVYGPGVKANFYKLLQLVNKALPLPLGSIKNRRSMVYVENLVDALILCATHPKATSQTYLLSDGHDVSTPQLISDIALAMQRPSRVFPLSLSLMRFGAKLLGRSTAVDRLTQSLEINGSKIRNELGWQPPYTMKQGLQATTDWFRELNSGPKAK
ncbi:NAD-dependent dehydratase [Methylovorus sp. MM2]|uniref:UDP-glucose 4-epimerase family protein n=1 Tax=Methylovorus sp. MM2 TaxID=1848038 RepID=UPI0007E299F3|nr:SDR family oxidoreductase [Methylovorus sp. MM2]OAM53136.1 NAD-dependent dehydratase [Methylovorus sp. MM2]